MRAALENSRAILVFVSEHSMGLVKINIDACISEIDAALSTLQDQDGVIERIRVAALEWYESLEDDGWNEGDILNGGLRPGISELFLAIRALKSPTPNGETP